MLLGKWRRCSLERAEAVVYELYVPVMEGEAADVEHNGTAYKLYINPFNTYDDSNIDGADAFGAGRIYLSRESGYT